MAIESFFESQRTDSFGRESVFLQKVILILLAFAVANVCFSLVLVEVTHSWLSLPLGFISLIILFLLLAAYFGAYKRKVTLLSLYIAGMVFSLVGLLLSMITVIIFITRAETQVRYYSIQHEVLFGSLSLCFGAMPFFAQIYSVLLSIRIRHKLLFPRDSRLDYDHYTFIVDDEENDHTDSQGLTIAFDESDDDAAELLDGDMF
eukprot:TRINITY_DN6788_c0_g1_i2.p1 TRINITY_DN6788_c0_g1~~TRINITY_DN6788_c0_g1_i2.p1  ORF type:complete len:204 (+),score=4.23 TRINITY_DN6788_c0_g1_i2:192-803(+)